MAARVANFRGGRKKGGLGTSGRPRLVGRAKKKSKKVNIDSKIDKHSISSGR